MAKQLRELLQEKQEPFILELHLLEKGYLRNRFDAKNLVQSCDVQRSQKGILPCSNKVLKDVCHHAISFNEKLRIKNSNPRELKNYETQELDRFSSASDAEETSKSRQEQHITIRVAEVVTDRKLQCQCTEESRQVPLNRADGTKQKNSTIASTLLPKKVTEDSILSASLWKILFQSAREKPAFPEIHELVHSRSNSKSKKVLQQTKQLLFDCVREIVETQEKKRKQQQRAYFATEDLGKLIEEKIRCWGKQYGQQLNLNQLLEFDFGNSEREWTNYKPQRRRIGCEIGDAILKEIMSQIVADLVHL